MKLLSGKLKLLLGNHVSKKIFVIGSGRSGTHWIGYILEAHPEIRATVEAEPAFGWVTRMALDPGTRGKLYPRLTRYYQFQHLLSAPKHYLDKSHPNIWLAEELANTFDDALFVGINRNPYGTVASMLRHRGVLSWHQRWREFPIPNKFLGIDDAEEAMYDSRSLPAKCAMRWKAHREQMDHLTRTLRDRIMVIQYEHLFTNTDEILGKLGAFIGLTTAIPSPVARSHSLDKWREQLSATDIRQIEDVVGISPEEVVPPSASTPFWPIGE
jgi:hypothetical protein